jgi:hypothetical protein
MPNFFTSERFQRALVWITALLLVAGAVAFLTVRAGRDDKGDEARPAPAAPPAVVDTQPTGRPGRVERGARIAAGEFILAAAGRENLKKAWELTHPELRNQCACSYKEWLTGNIPVQYYPVGNLDVAAFSIEEASPNHAILLVALVPEDGAKVKEQTFFIGLKKRTQGGKKRWLVNYWAPYSADATGSFAPAE